MRVTKEILQFNRGIVKQSVVRLGVRLDVGLGVKLGGDYSKLLWDRAFFM
jgi:hypothetical protein